MTDQLAKLLDLRRLRERQATADQQRAARRHATQAAHVQSVEAREREVIRDADQRIEQLYADVIGAALSLADLERLAADIDRQRQRKVDMRIELASQRQHREHLAAEAEKARQALLSRQRTVRKLEGMADEMAKTAVSLAEAKAENDLERPTAAAWGENV